MKIKLITIMMCLFFAGIIRGEDFNSIRVTLKDTSLTDFQRDNLIKSYIGKDVLWKGWIYDVKERTIIGGYVCTVSMDEPNSFRYSADFTFPIDVGLALKLRKGRVVWVQGKIKWIHVGLMYIVNLDEQRLLLENPKPE